jgi:hypothetical protein
VEQHRVAPDLPSRLKKIFAGVQPASSSLASLVFTPVLSFLLQRFCTAEPERRVIHFKINMVAK